MRIILNQSKFARIKDASAVDKGLYMVVAKHNDGQRLLMDERGHNLWITQLELMASFRDATKDEARLYFGQLKKNALDAYKKT